MGVIETYILEHDVIPDEGLNHDSHKNLMNPLLTPWMSCLLRFVYDVIIAAIQIVGCHRDRV